MTYLNESLTKITKGTVLVFLGSLLGLGFAFLGRVLVARIWTEAEYGVFSLAYAALSIFTIIATLGLEQGVTRSIAFARGRSEDDKVRNLIPASIQFGFLASISLGIILFFASETIATGIFNDPGLGLPLKVFALGIPFYTVVKVFGAIFQGFDDIKPRVYFNEILRNLLFPLFLSPFLFFDWPFDAVFYAFLASLVIPGGLIIVYTAKRLQFPLRPLTNIRTNLVARELLLFSLPLVAVGMLHMILVWIDTIMIGGFKTSTDVGLYNAAHPLAQFISMPLTAMLLIYMPITSGIYGRGEMHQMRRNFSILTKWLCAATLPLFLIMFFFADTIIGFLFGAGYEEAASALRILSLGGIINNVLGPNGATLIALGKTHFVMWAMLATVVLNIILNAVLIPPMGIEGAAIASVGALTLINILRCVKLYSISKVHPLSRNLMKIILSFPVIIGIFQLIFGIYVDVDWWMLPLLFALYYIIYGLVVLCTRSLDREDIAILLTIAEKVRINTGSVK
ncbi:MAG: flippase, partial [Gammaproteobacteria bacterium]|nr:flippase [Gammaproteobacteria bacterium]